MSVEQVVHFYFVLLRDVNCAWAAVMFILGLLLGERSELLCSVQDAWLTGLNPAEGRLPRCFIQQINKKTKEREVPLDAAFGQLMWTWTSEQPLLGGYASTIEPRTQWPHERQTLFQTARRRTGKQPLGRYLFPGRVLGGHNMRAWTKHVSPRGFFGKFQKAQDVLIEQLRVAQEHHTFHPFHDIDVKRITTHSMKKSAVTLLKSSGCSTAIVAAITGTSARVLDAVYDVPTQRRQRQATSAFQPVLRAMVPEASELASAQVVAPKPLCSSESLEPDSGSHAYCVRCGHKVASTWLYCRRCGQKQPCS